MTQEGIEKYNLGTGRGYSVLELVHTFEEVTGQDIPYQISKRRAGDIGECYADVTKARELLGWQAKRDIVEICEDAWRWQRENPRGYEEEV